MNIVAQKLRDLYWNYSSEVSLEYKGDCVSVSGNYNRKFQNGPEDESTQFRAIHCEKSSLSEAYAWLDDIRYQHQIDHLTWCLNKLSHG